MHLVARKDPGYFCKKVTGMLTREQILEIDQYCQEHKVSQQQRLNELGIGRHQFYVWKRKYRLEDEAGNTPCGFVQLRPGGEFMPSSMPPAKTSGKRKGASSMQESFLTVEIRTSSGTAMRIQGNMTAAHLHEIISAG